MGMFSKAFPCVGQGSRSSVPQWNSYDERLVSGFVQLSALCEGAYMQDSDLREAAGALPNPLNAP